jgi:hypothetical protein
MFPGKFNRREFKKELQCVRISLNSMGREYWFGNDLTCCNRPRIPSAILSKLHNSFNLKFHAEPYSIAFGLNDENQIIFLFENSVVLYFVIQ